MFGTASHLDSKIWDEIIKKVDKDHDGLISLSEFKDMMLNISEN